MICLPPLSTPPQHSSRHGPQHTQHTASTQCVCKCQFNRYLSPLRYPACASPPVSRRQADGLTQAPGRGTAEARLQVSDDLLTPTGYKHTPTENNTPDTHTHTRPEQHPKPPNEHPPQTLNNARRWRDDGACHLPRPGGWPRRRKCVFRRCLSPRVSPRYLACAPPPLRPVHEISFLYSFLCSNQSSVYWTPRLQFPHYCNTIARPLRNVCLPPATPLCLPYTIHYW